METLRHWRAVKGVTQVELSEKTGVAQDTISAIELGKRTPHASTLRKLARALDLDIGDLYRDPTREPVGARSIYSLVRQIAENLEAAEAKPENTTPGQELHHAKAALEGVRMLGRAMSSGDLTVREQRDAEALIDRLLGISDRAITRAEQESPEPELEQLLERVRAASAA